MKERMSESSTNQGPIGISTNETSVGVPTRQGQAPLEQLPSPSHRRRNLTLGGAAAIGTAAIVAVASRFGGTPRPQNPDTTPLPVGIVEPSPTGGMPSADATINVAEQTFEATMPPTPSVEPTLPPTPEPTSSPRPTETPTLQPTTTPSEIPHTKDVVEIIKALAVFDAGGELKGNEGNYEINYSRALLDNAGIKSISTDPGLVDKAHQVTLKLTYDAVHAKIGSVIKFRYVNHEDITTKVDAIEDFTVTFDEFVSINNALQENGISFDTNGQYIIYKQENGTLIHVRRSSASNGLAQDPDTLRSLSIEDLADAATFDGAAFTMIDIRASALKGKFGDEYSEGKPDPVYEVFDTANQRGGKLNIVRE